MYLRFFFVSQLSYAEVVPVAPVSTIPPENIPATLTPPMTPVRSSPPRTINSEERALQLRKQISLLAAEREDLVTQLKITRRDSQRAEAALKSEIESLRRASEKHSTGEHRSRQKVLALQEAVKQSTAAATEMEQKAKGIEDILSTLNRRAKEAQELHDRTNHELKQRRNELRMSLTDGTKAVQNLQGELNSICAKIDKLNGKKDKLEKETIPQLEEKLNELRNSVETLEMDTQKSDERYDEESQNGWSSKNWVPPIQRPSPQQRSSYPPSVSYGSNNAPTRPGFHSPHLSDFTSYGAPNNAASLSSHIPKRDTGTDQS